MGSGHMLAAAFDVLMDIYHFQGYTDRDAVRAIVENNLFGLDIDNRAAQLGYFAVMMKACEYDPRFLHRGVQPHVHAITESVPLPDLAWEYLGSDAATARALQTLFADAKEYGSILTVDVSEVALAALRARLQNLGDDLIASAVRAALLPLVEQAEIMGRTYDVVVTNPPYMGSSGMNEKLSRYVKENFPDSKADLFAVFMERVLQLVKKEGYSSMITMESWMFLSSFENLRTKLNQNNTIVTLVHMPYLGKGGTSLGINFGTDMAVIAKRRISAYVGTYDRIAYYETDDEGVPFEFPVKNEYYKKTKQDNFEKIPGAPVAYWASQRILEAFRQGKNIGDLSIVRTGMQTGKNELFVRLWFEVEDKKCKLNATSCKEAVISAAKYFPYNKGGEYRKWYGNNEYVVDWENKGYRIFHNSKEERRKTINYPDELKFSPSVTWSLITSGESSFRYKDNAISDIAGMSLYNAGMRTKFYLALCNSKICSILLKILSPTLNTQAGDMARIPVIFSEQKEKEIIDLSEENVSISKSDWDSFETSWDFKKHPLI